MAMGPRLFEREDNVRLGTYEISGSRAEDSCCFSAFWA